MCVCVIAIPFCFLVLPFVYIDITSSRFALIRAYIPDLDETEQEKLLLKWVPAEKEKKPSANTASAFSAEYMPDLLSYLGTEQDAKEFEDLKSYYEDEARRQFVLSRVGRSRASAETYTPKVVKNLRPPRHGVVLVWQFEAGAFQGYFPIEREASASVTKDKQKLKTHFSRSRSYNTNRTKLQALKEIVNWLWKLHQDSKGDPQH